MLLAVVSRVRLWKQQLSLFLPDPRDLEGVIWKSLQLLEPLSMEGIIPREVSHVSPCDAASVPIFLPALEFTQTSGLSSLVESYPPCATAQSWGSGAANVQANPGGLSSKQVPAINRTQHPSTHVLQHGPVSPCAALLGRASKGEEARESPGEEECSQALHSAF